MDALSRLLRCAGRCRTWGTCSSRPIGRLCLHAGWICAHARLATRLCPAVASNRLGLCVANIANFAARLCQNSLQWQCRGVDCGTFRFGCTTAQQVTMLFLGLLWGWTRTLLHLYAIGSEQEPSSVTKRAAAVKDRPPDSAAHSYFGLLEVSQHALSHVLCDQTQAHSAVPSHQLECWLGEIPTLLWRDSENDLHYLDVMLQTQCRLPHIHARHAHVWLYSDSDILTRISRLRY